MKASIKARIKKEEEAMSHHWLSQQMFYLSLFVFLLSGCFIPLLAQTILSEKGIKQNSGRIVYHPIGLFHTELTPQTGAPRQGVLQPESREIQSCCRFISCSDFILPLDKKNDCSKNAF